MTRGLSACCRSTPLFRRAAFAPPRGSGEQGKLPFRGSALGEGRASGELGLRGLHPRGWGRAAGLPACLPKVSLTFLVVSLPDRGRRVLLGAAAPRSTPFHPPPATPLALASTLRAPASASPSPRPQRAARLPLRGALELHAACRAGVSGKELREITSDCEAPGRLEGRRSSVQRSPTRQAACFSKEDNSPPQSGAA